MKLKKVPTQRLIIIFQPHFSASCDSTKHTFADQLVKTNAFRQRYYHELLPGVLDELQSMEQKRIELIRHGILSCVAKEREVRDSSLFTFFSICSVVLSCLWCVLIEKNAQRKRTLNLPNIGN